MVAILIAITIVLGGFGFLYAWFIYYHPITPTWVSVAIGTGAICISESGAIFVVLWFNGLFYQLWWMIFIPPVCLGLAGLPMAIWQQKKWLEMKNHNQEVTHIWTNN